MPSPRSSSRRSSKSSSKGSSKSSSKGSSSSKKAKTRKQVRIHSPLNQTRNYSLSSTEKAHKKTMQRYKNCPAYPEFDDFPCVKAYSVFDNMAEYEEHKDLLGLRNNSRVSSINSHYLKTRKKHVSEGKYSRKIPHEFRVYNKDTGEIHDIRFF